jgi:hypothetical protein
VATADHDCPDRLRREMAPIKITVSTAPPLVRGPYTTDGFRCPHGVNYWIEPTGEQIAEWAQGGES